MKTLNDLNDLIRSINYLLNRSIDTFELSKRNGFIYIQYIKSGKTIFNNATTKKEIYIALYSFREGLYFNIDK